MKYFLPGNTFIFLLAGHEVKSSLLPRVRPSTGDQVANIPKIAAQDTTLTVSKADGEKITFPAPSGAEVELHVPGLHHNRMLSGFSSWDKFSRCLATRY